VKKLPIAADFALPLDVVTETIAVLGIRGSGKTNTCVALTEELLDAGQQVVIIDPTDAWWGLRSSKDGKTAAYPVVVFGGRHGDVPLNSGDGAAIADFVVEERVPAILSLRHLESQADQRRIVTDFARRLYHRKGEAGRDTAMLLVIDEAHLFIPQRVGAAEAQMVGAIQKLVRQGRSSGIGVAVIDQRASSVNKDILTQLELLICHRTSAPLDQKALTGWIEQHDKNDRQKEFLGRLAMLPKGTAWVWSPGWLDVFREVEVRLRKTFDSSATPKPGARAIAPTTLAPVDLDGLRVRLAATIEKEKADDPKELRKRIAELETQVARRDVKPEKVIERVEVPAIGAVTLNELQGMSNMIVREAAAIREACDRVVAHNARQDVPRVGVNEEKRQPVRESVAQIARMSGARATGGAVGSGGLSRILIALAQRPNGLTNRQIGVRAGLSSRSGTFSTYISRARGEGWLEGSGELRITRGGLAALGNYEPLPTGDALAEHWLNELGGGASRILRVLIVAYPKALEASVIGERAEISHKSGTYSTYVSRLRGLELISGRGELRASEELFG
jgi:hypothetical protein